MAFIILLALVPVAVYFFSGRKVVEAAPASTLFFDPATVTVTNNQAFSLNARINPGTNQITAVDMKVTFDASKFRLDTISSNSTAFPQVLQAAQIDNAAGTASIILGAPFSPLTPVTTTTTVATFNFTAIGTSGTGNISFASGTQASALNEPSNVLIQMTPSQVTIGRTYGISDFTALVADWLQTKTSVADVNGDGKINARDLGIMMSNWSN